MPHPRPLSVLVLAAALLIGAGPYLVRAAGVRQAAAVTANVDMARLLADSDAHRTATSRVQAFARTEADRFDETARLQYLSTAEIEDYTNALNADKQTDAQKARLTALKGESARRTAEAGQLAARKEADLTAPDRARLRELAAMEQQRPAALDTLKRLYQNEVHDEEARLMREADAQVREIVAKVAKEVGVTEVFDTTSLVVAPIDLTQQAMGRVKKR